MGDKEARANIGRPAELCMAASATDEQLDRFKMYVRSLNEQFARWIVQQWETKSDKFWSHGMVDYLRHAVIIKRDHPDAAALLGTPPTAIVYIW